MRPDLLLAMKNVAIELTDVVESSDIIFIEFAMYLWSLSTLHTFMLVLLPHQSTHFQELKFWEHKHSSTLSQHAFRVQKPTGIKTSLLSLPPKQPITSNERKFWKRWSFATNSLGRHFVQIALFVRMRSLDECQVAVRSHKADFLSRIERWECVELMRVARYFMSGSGIACSTFATNGVFFCVKIGEMPFSDFNP